MITAEPIEDIDDFKLNYTQEENYRAYKLFSMMDVDNGGALSLREVFRVLMGDVVRYLPCDFSHPDTGIVWGLDEEKCVIIMSIEENSLAMKFPFLIQRMRLHKINDTIIPPIDHKSLQLVYQTLLKLHDDPCTMEFVEPVLIINKFSSILDIEAENRMFSINLPIGAVYNLDIFKENMGKALILAHPSLRFIKIDFILQKRQIFFKCNQYPFRLMFATGPNYRRSCRYALGYSAEDTELSNYHIGQPLLIDLNLGLDEEKTELLMVELFNKFDTDGSGEFEFEEFRNFYIKFLDTAESLERLKRYAQHRFRDIEAEKFVLKKMEERENKWRRRQYLKEKFKDLVSFQRKRFKDNSHVDRFGVRRRFYRHRTNQQQKQPNVASRYRLSQLPFMISQSFKRKMESIKEASPRQAEPEDEEKALEDKRPPSPIQEEEPVSEKPVTLKPFEKNSKPIEEELFDDYTIPSVKSAIEKENQVIAAVGVDEDQQDEEVYEDAGEESPEEEEEVEFGVSLVLDDGEEKNSRSVHSAENKSGRSKKGALKRLDSSKTLGTEMSGLTDTKGSRSKRLRIKDKQTRQSIRRKKIIQKIIEANQALKKQEKADEQRIFEKTQEERMKEVHFWIKKGLMRAFKNVSSNWQAPEEDEEEQSHYSGQPKMPLNLDVTVVAASPALKLDSAIFSSTMKASDIDLTDLPASKLHPAGQRYFFIRENQFKSLEFDSNLKHPAFFMADYERNPSRHSAVALGVAKIIRQQQEEGVQYRQERGIPRVLAVPPEDVVPSRRSTLPGNSRAKRRKKRVRFLELDTSVVMAGVEARKKALTLLGRCTLLYVKLSGLVGVHLLGSNSPFVRLDCSSDYRYTTEVNANAGSSSEWEGLGWMFRIHSADVLQFSVFSGSTTRHEEVGKFEISAVALTQAPMDSSVEGVFATISGDLMKENTDGTRKNMGFIEVHMQVELGHEWDWVVALYDRTKEKKRLAIQHEKYLAVRYKKEIRTDSVNFPLKLSVASISLSQIDEKTPLDPLLFIKTPVVILSCGTYEWSTDHLGPKGTFQGGEKELSWDNLAWELAMHSAKANLIFLVFAEKKAIGRFVVNAKELTKLPRTSHGELELEGEVWDAGQSVGSISIQLALHIEEKKEVEETVVPQMSIDSVKNTLILPAIFLPGTISLVFPYYSEETTTASPFKRRKDKTFLLQCDCGHWKSTVVVARKSAVPVLNGQPEKMKDQFVSEWSDLDWAIPVTDTSVLTLKVYTGDKTDEKKAKDRRAMDTKSLTFIGSISVRMLELQKEKFDEENRMFSAVERKLSDGRRIFGWLRLLDTRVDYEGNSELVQHRLRLLAEALNQTAPLVSGYGQIPLSANVSYFNDQFTKYSAVEQLPGPQGSPSGSSYMNESFASSGAIINAPSRPINQTKPTKTDTQLLATNSLSFGTGANMIAPTMAFTSPTLHSTAPLYPLRIIVTDVIATDLKAMHFFSKNSARLNVSCGSTAAVTPVIESAGDAAQWTGLNLVVVASSASVNARFAMWSGETQCIGSEAIPPNDLFHRVADASGKRETFLTLKDENNYVTGKLRISFLVEQNVGFMMSTTSLEGQTAFVHHATPPIFLSIRTIAVIDVRAVHRFSRNSPSVRVSLLKNDADSSTLTRKRNPYRQEQWERRSATQEQAGGNAKWEELGWDVVIRSREAVLHLVLSSGSIVVGERFIGFEEITQHFPDSRGNCELESFWLDRVQQDRQVGLLRLMYGYETYVEEEEPDSGGEEPQTVEDETLETHSFSYAVDHRAPFISELPNQQIAGETSEYRQQQWVVNLSHVRIDLPYQHGDPSEVGSDSEGEVENIEGNENKTEVSEETEKDILPPEDVSKVKEDTDGMKDQKSTNDSVSSSEKHTSEISYSLIVEVQCGDYLSRSGVLISNQGRVVWVDPFICFPVTPETVFVVNIVRNDEGRSILGSLHVPVSEVLEKEREGKDVEKHFPVNSIAGPAAGPPRMGLAVLGLSINQVVNQRSVPALNLSGSLVSQNPTKRRFNNSQGDSTAIKTLLSLPFVMKIQKISATDITHNNRRILFCPDDSVKVLTVDYDGWSKVTPSAPPSTQPGELKGRSTEWMDEDWVFIVTSVSTELGLNITLHGVSLGCMKVIVSDLINCSTDRDDIVQLYGLLLQGKTPVGKLQLTLSFSPYSTPLETERAQRLQVEMLPSVTLVDPNPVVGFFRVKRVHLREMSQVLGFFRNSPKVHLSLGDFSATTSVAVDAGGDCTWDRLQWGRVPLRDHCLLNLKVTSGNETVGMCFIQLSKMTEMLQIYQTVVEIGGELRDGIVKKGLIFLEVLPVAKDVGQIARPVRRYVEDEMDQPDQLDFDTRFNKQGPGSIDTKSYGSQTLDEDLHSPVHVSPSFNTVFSATKEDFIPHTSPASAQGQRLPRLKETRFASTLPAAPSQLTMETKLSLSTATPARTTVSVLGLSVYELAPLSGVYRNSPQLRLYCGGDGHRSWTARTGVAHFAGDAANWIIKRSSGWTFTMRAVTFLKVSVFSGGDIAHKEKSAVEGSDVGQELGSVYISTRELIEVPVDEQGISTIYRLVEKNLHVIGKIRLTLAVQPHYGKSASIFHKERQNLESGDNTDDPQLFGKFAERANLPSRPSTNEQHGVTAQMGSTTIVEEGKAEQEAGLIRKPLSHLKLPVTVNVTQISCCNVPQLYGEPNSLSASFHIAVNNSDTMMEQQRQKTSEKPLCGDGALWEDLDWSWDLSDPQAVLVLTVWNKKTEVGSFEIPVPELLSLPCTSQGFVEVLRNIRGSSGILGKFLSVATPGKVVKGVGDVMGQVQLCLLLSPAVSAEVRERQCLRAEAELFRTLQEQRVIAHLRVFLVTANEVNRMFSPLTLHFSVGQWSAVSSPVGNRGGSVVWSDTAAEWQDIVVMERAQIIFTVRAGGNTIEDGKGGMILASAVMPTAALLSAPTDSDGFLVLYKELLDGLQHAGTISIAYKLSFPDDVITASRPVTPMAPRERHGEESAAVAFSAARTMDDSDVLESNKALTITGGGDLVLNAAEFDVTKGRVVSVVATQMKAVHRVGKNSPMVRMEIQGVQSQSSSLPYKGSEGEWVDLGWGFNGSARRIRFKVTSGAVMIGEARFTSEDIDKARMTNPKTICLEQALRKNGQPTGKLSIQVEFERKKEVEEDENPAGNTVLHGFDPIGTVLRAPQKRTDSADSTEEQLKLELSSLNQQFAEDDFTALRSDRSNSTIWSNYSESTYSGSSAYSSNYSTDSSEYSSSGYSTSRSSYSDSEYTSYAEEVDLSTSAESATTANSTTDSDAGTRDATSVAFSSRTGSYSLGSASAGWEEESRVSVPIKTVPVTETANGAWRPKTSRGEEGTIVSPKKIPPPVGTENVTIFEGNDEVVERNKVEFNLKKPTKSAPKRDETVIEDPSIDENSESGGSVTGSWYTLQTGRSFNSLDSSYTQESSYTGTINSSYATESSYTNDQSTSYSSYTPDESSYSFESSYTRASSYTGQGSSVQSSSHTVQSANTDDSSNSSATPFSASDWASTYTRDSSFLSVSTAGSSYTHSSVSNTVMGVEEEEVSVQEDPSTFVLSPPNEPFIPPRKPSVQTLYSGNFPSVSESRLESQGEGWKSRSEFEFTASSDRNPSDFDVESDRSFTTRTHSTVSSQFSEHSGTEAGSRWSTPRSQDSLYSDVSTDSDISSLSGLFLGRIQPSLVRPVLLERSPTPTKRMLRSLENRFGQEAGTFGSAMDVGERLLEFNISELWWVNDKSELRIAVCRYVAEDMISRLVTKAISQRTNDILKSENKKITYHLSSSILNLKPLLPYIYTHGEYLRTPLDSPEWVQHNYPTGEQRRRNRCFYFQKEYALLSTRYFVQQGANAAMRHILIHGSKGLPVEDEPEVEEPPSPTNSQDTHSTVRYKKRGAVFLGTDGMVELNPLNLYSTSTEEEEDQADPLVSLVVKKKATIIEVPPKPLEKAKISFLDILGIDLTVATDLSVMPKRPYLTACRPYGNWAAETPVVHLNFNNLHRRDLVLNWYDLSGKWKWDVLVLRRGQCVVFDIHDAGSGLVFAKCTLPFEKIMERHIATGKEEVAVYMEFLVANEYGGGRMGGVMRVSLDMSVNVFKKPEKSPEYWDKHRPEHWTNYPLVPTSTGMVRQRYREISEDYDQQKIIHPCFYGFRVRWRGRVSDEPRFVNPIFSGFSLARKPLPHGVMKEMSRRVASTAKPNPYKWDSQAARRGKCPVCSDGVEGCPRCYMLPPRPDGQNTTPDEFAFDPDEEKARLKKQQHKLTKIEAKRIRQLTNIRISADTGEYEEGSLGSLSTFSSEFHDNLNKLKEIVEVEGKEKMQIHTQLTTFRALKAYRNVVQNLITLYIKIMPTGGVKKLIVDASDTIINVYNSFNSHCEYGNKNSSMLVLPLLTGMFELRRELSWESDLLLAETRGRDCLGDYGLLQRKSVIVMLFFSSYKAEYAPRLLCSYFAKNTQYHLTPMPTYECVEKLPKNIHQDEVQSYLRRLIEAEYITEQKEIRAFYQARGVAHRRGKDARIAAQQKRHQAEMKRKKMEVAAMKLRLESQLKGLKGKDRRRAMKALKMRELTKKRNRGSVIESGEEEEGDENDIGPGTGEEKGSVSDDASVISLSAVELDEAEEADEEAPLEDENAAVSEEEKKRLLVDEVELSPRSVHTPIPPGVASIPTTPRFYVVGEAETTALEEEEEPASARSALTEDSGTSLEWTSVDASSYTSYTSYEDSDTFDSSSRSSFSSYYTGSSMNSVSLSTSTGSHSYTSGTSSMYSGDSSSVESSVIVMANPDRRPPYHSGESVTSLFSGYQSSGGVTKNTDPPSIYSDMPPSEGSSTSRSSYSSDSDYTSLPSSRSSYSDYSSSTSGSRSTGGLFTYRSNHSGTSSLSSGSDYALHLGQFNAVPSVKQAFPDYNSVSAVSLQSHSRPWSRSSEDSTQSSYTIFSGDFPSSRSSSEYSRSSYSDTISPRSQSETNDRSLFSPSSSRPSLSPLPTQRTLSQSSYTSYTSPSSHSKATESLLTRDSLSTTTAGSRNSTRSSRSVATSRSSSAQSSRSSYSGSESYTGSATKSIGSISGSNRSPSQSTVSRTRDTFSVSDSYTKQSDFSSEPSPSKSLEYSKDSYSSSQSPYSLSSSEPDFSAVSSTVESTSRSGSVLSRAGYSSYSKYTTGSEYEGVGSDASSVGQSSASYTSYDSSGTPLYTSESSYGTPGTEGAGSSVTECSSRFVQQLRKTTKNGSRS